MQRKIILLTLTVVMAASFAHAGKMPLTYKKKCKVCHNTPGNVGKNGPNLANSTLTFEQFEKQVANGSKWEGKPAKLPGYEKGKMPKLKIKKKDVKSIYAYIHAGDEK